MEIFNQLIQYALHLDAYLFSFVNTYGVWTYVVLFAIIFCETGLIVTPFLPGDSLLFAAGSIAANTVDTLNIQLLFLLLMLASIVGNKVNYLVGRAIGPKIFDMAPNWLLSRKHLEEAHHFYAKHGGKTIILARFIPIIRTFGPFVAGIASMNLKQFSFFNIISAILWVGTLLSAGYFFGSLPFVKEHFTTIVYILIAASLLPPIFTYFFRKKGHL